MEVHGTSFAIGVLGVVGIVLYGLAVGVSRQRGEHGRTAFAIFTALLATAAVGGPLASVAGFAVEDGPWQLAVFGPLYLGVAPWFAFVVRYKGRSELLSGRRIALLSAPIGLFVGLAATSIAAGAPMADGAAFGLVLTFVWLYTLGIAFAGVALLLQTTHLNDRLPLRHGVALALPAVAPQVFLMVGGVLLGPIGDVAFLGASAAGFVVSGAAIWLSTYRFGSFDSAAAAAGTVGPEIVLSELQNVILVVDDRERLVELNGAARDAFGASDRDALGEPLEAVIGATVEELETEGVVALETTDGRRRFDTRASKLTDDRGRRLGTAFSLRDVTRWELHEQRIQILHRLLRHNLRNKLTVVRGNAELIADGEATEDAAGRIEEVSDELIALGEQAQEIETVLRRERSTAEFVRLEPVVETVVEEARRRFPDVALDSSVPEDVRARASDLSLQYVLSELVENAAEYNDDPAPRVSVAVDAGGDRVLVSVVDNGPGIPESEVKPIRKGEESPLEHGSGLSLWGIHWVVTQLGGTVSFAENEPRGTRVRIELPRASGADDPEGSLSDRSAIAAAERDEPRPGAC